VLYIIGFIALFFLVYYLIYKRLIFVQTVSGAIVMAVGVFSLNVGPNFSENALWYKLLALVTIIIWAFFMTSFAASILTSKFKKIHYEHPIGRFRIGTWVASTSVTVIIISNYFPIFNRIVIPLIIINTCLWLIYFIVSIKTIIQIWTGKSNENVNGILLLTTVSTQSLALMYNNVWDDFSSYFYINMTLIILGFIFYLLSALLMLKRYVKFTWSLVDDWMAPNCILHGALSIIGSAALISQTFSYRNLLALWSVVFFIFIIHEILEISRGVFRIQRYGFIKGIAFYHPSQWSRIFTFCMFYTFTLKFNTNFNIKPACIASTQEAILIYGKWIIAAILIIEIALLVHSLVTSQKQFKTSFR